MELLSGILINTALGLIYGSYAVLTYLVKDNDKRRYRQSINFFVIITLLFATGNIVSGDYVQLLARGFMIVGVAIAPFTCKAISDYRARRQRESHEEVTE